MPHLDPDGDRRALAARLASARTQLTFGANLSWLRKAQSMTQQRLADLSGVDRQTINRAERGRVAISVVRAAQLAAALELPVEELFRTDADEEGE